MLQKKIYNKNKTNKQYYFNFVTKMCDIICIILFIHLFVTLFHNVLWYIYFLTFVGTCSYCKPLFYVHFFFIYQFNYKYYIRIMFILHSNSYVCMFNFSMLKLWEMILYVWKLLLWNEGQEIWQLLCRNVIECKVQCDKKIQSTGIVIQFCFV